MEAASLPRPRSRRPTWKAPLALALYAAAVAVAWSLVSGAGSLTLPSTPASATATPAPAQAPLGVTGDDLALRTLATRAGRSVVGVGSASGFVAWTANGLSLVVTARPAGGWATGPDRSITVTAAGEELAGKLVRADRRTGLGLVRVDGELARPLWQRRSAAPVSPGDRLAIAGGAEPRLFSAGEVRHAAIWGAGAGTQPGSPVLDSSGRVVGVTTGGRVVPIDRACGPIRRCG